MIAASLVVFTLGTQSCPLVVGPLVAAGGTQPSCAAPADVPPSTLYRVQSIIDERNSESQSILERAVARAARGAPLKNYGTALRLASSVPLAGEVFGLPSAIADIAIDEIDENVLRPAIENAMIEFLDANPEQINRDNSQLFVSAVNYMFQGVDNDLRTSVLLPAVNRSLEEIGRTNDVVASIQSRLGNMEGSAAQIKEDFAQSLTRAESERISARADLQTQSRELRAEIVQQFVRSTERSQRALDIHIRASEARNAAQDQVIDELSVAVQYQRGALQETNARVSNLSLAVGGIQEDLRGLDSRLASNQQDVEALSSVLWETGDDNLRLALIRNTQGPRDKTPEELARLERELTTRVDRTARLQKERAELQSRQETLQRADAYRQLASQGVALAVTNGLVSPEDAEEANRILSYTGIAIGVGRLFAQDYVGGASSIMSGLGGLSGQRDPNAPLIGYLQEQFKVVNKKLDDLVVKTEEIQNELVQIQVNLADIREENRFLHAKLENLVNRNISRSDYIISAISQMSPADCQALRPDDLARYRFDLAMWPFEDEASKATKCMVDVALVSRPETNPYFHNVVGSNEINQSLERYSNVRSLRRSLGWIEVALPNFTGTGAGASDAESRCLSSPLLSPGRIMALARSVISLEPALYYRQTDGTLAEPETYDRERHLRLHRRMESYYNNLIDAVDCSVNQQLTLTGLSSDSFVEAVASHWTQNLSSSRAIRKELIELLDEVRDPLLERNVVAHVLSVEWGRAGRNFAVLADVKRNCVSGNVEQSVARLNATIVASRARFAVIRANESGCTLALQSNVEDPDTPNRNVLISLAVPPPELMITEPAYGTTEIADLVRLRIDLEDRRASYRVSKDLFERDLADASVVNQIWNR